MTVKNAPVLWNGPQRVGGQPGNFWQFRDAADGVPELLLYGDIASATWYGDEVTPKQFCQDLEALGDVPELRVRISSGGGDVFAATAIGNALEQHKATVTAVIDGLCASAATIIACHCDRVKAAADTIYMIHPVRVGIYDFVDEKTLQNAIQAVQAIRSVIVKLYARKTCRAEDEVAAWMDATSYWSAEQAMENGFVDELIQEPVRMENHSGFLIVNGMDMHMKVESLPENVQNRLGRIADNEPDRPAEEEEDMPVSTVDELRNEYQDLVSQIEAAAVERERQRIRDIEEMQMPGCEEIANDAKFVNPVAAMDFAAACIREMKKQGQKYLNGIRKDSDSSGAGQVANQQPKAMQSTEDVAIDAIRAAGRKPAGK